MSNKMSVKERIEGLDLCQLIELHRQAGEIIAAAQAEPMRIVWRVSNGNCCIKNFRTEDFANASALFLTIYKKLFDENAADFLKHGGNIYTFNEHCPSITAERITRFEYENEWFPNGEAEA